jgi:propionyl-CoA carboxylase alpha chain
MIQRVLVANRGEIARRIFKTCRRLGIGTAAIYSDQDATEPHCREADVAVHLPGDSAATTYLNGKAILDAAREAGADAVHPGYGFLAENAEFAKSVLDAGLIWVGPSPAAIATMGSKLESKRLMRESEVPTLDGVSLSGLTAAQVKEEADLIGYPILVKASAGGGGKGMRIVPDSGSLEASVEAAMRESASAFGDDTVFLEKYLEAPRHIEIQIVGDNSGTVVSLFERECSIQRRHQKIIEEGPSPALDPDLRRIMGRAAVKAARAVDYTGAGTVEFLFQNGEFYFLEMNTRLQVEHPVTEMVTGLDLVELQILVANGFPLPEDVVRPALSGHAIEARLYAEDPANDYLPVTGVVHRFDFSSFPDIRVDSGVESGSHISILYDPMLAKVISHAPTRAEAVSTLATALRGARIHSSTTNRDMLVRVLEHPDFIAGDINTHFLSESAQLERLIAPLASEVDEAFAARAAALADQALERSASKVLRSVPSGWRNLPRAPQLRSYRGSLSEHHVSYSLEGPQVLFEGEDSALIIECSPIRVVFDRCGEIHEFDVARYGDARYVDSSRVSVRLVELPRFPPSVAEESEGSLHSPMPGKIVRVDVATGDPVIAGQVLIVLEAMKMEHAISAPYAGTVTLVSYAPGDQVEAGATLAVVETSE